MRHGVLLSPRQADIFDLIENSGDRGVLGEVLAYVFYPDKPRRGAGAIIGVTINQLNSVLEPTRVKIKLAGHKQEPYKVIPR